MKLTLVPVFRLAVMFAESKFGVTRTVADSRVLCADQCRDDLTRPDQPVTGIA